MKTAYSCLLLLLVLYCRHCLYDTIVYEDTSCEYSYRGTICTIHEQQLLPAQHKYTGEWYHTRYLLADEPKIGAYYYGGP